MPEPEEIDPQNDRPEEPIDHTVLNPTHEDIAIEDEETAAEEREERGEEEPAAKPFQQVVTKAGAPPPVDETDPLRSYPVETSQIYHSDADLAVQPLETAEEAPLGAAGAQRKPENEQSMVPGLHEAPRIARSSEET